MTLICSSSNAQKNAKKRDFSLEKQWNLREKQSQLVDVEHPGNCDATAASASSLPQAAAAPEYPAHQWTRYKHQRFLKIWQVAMLSLGHPPTFKMRTDLLQGDQTFAVPFQERKNMLKSWMTPSVRRHGKPLVVDHESNEYETSVMNRYVDAHVGLTLLLECDPSPAEAALAVHVALGKLSLDDKEHAADTSRRSCDITKERKQACRIVYAIGKLHFELESRSIDHVAQDMEKVLHEVPGTSATPLSAEIIKKMLMDARGS